MFYFLLAFYLLATAHASPAMVHVSSHSPAGNAASGPASPTYISSVASARSLLLDSGVAGVEVESVVYVLPPTNDAHGLSISPKLTSTRAAFEAGPSPTVFSHVDGGVSIERIKGALMNGAGHPSVVVDGIENIPELMEAGRTYIVNVSPESSIASIDSSISAMMKSPPSSSSSKRVVMVAAATTSSESASRRSARRLANDSSSSPTYYVYMTPNIMAGVLFGFLFIFISIIGFSCMNDLEGQTVFVSKLPAVGKEA